MLYLFQFIKDSEDFMKIFISVLIVSMLVFIGAAGYHIYGISVPLKVSPISNESIVNDIEVLKPLPEKVVGVIEIPTPKEEPNDILEEIPDYELVSVEKYSTIKTSNYVKSNKIFVFNAQGFEEVFANTDDIYLKAGTLKKLIKVNENLLIQGYNLEIWIGYRDETLQQQLREHLEITMGIKKGRSDLVAAPGKSQHQKGTAVDVTLSRIDGNLLEMPSEYLDFTDNRLPSLHKDNEALKVLQEAMTANEMNIYQGEWWHFNDSNKEYLDVQ